MQRVQHPTASATLPTSTFTGTIGYYTNGDPTLGVLPTYVTAENLNQLQEEIIGAITASGQTPSNSSTSQLTQAIINLPKVAISAYTGSYSDGIVVDYSTGFGRISVGTADALQFFGSGFATGEMARFDTSGNLCIGTTTAAATLTVNGPIAMKPPGIVAATTYTVAATDAVLVFNTTAACTVTLPTPSTCSGRVLYVKNIAAFAINSASSNVVPANSGTPGTAIAAAAAGTLVKMISNGTYWIVF